MGVFERRRKSSVVYYVTFVWNGRQVQERAGTDKRLAQQLERQRKREVRDGTYRPDKKSGAISLAAYVAQWLELRKRRGRRLHQQDLGVPARIGYFRICAVHSVQELSFLDAHIRRRLRAIVLRHWRRRRNRALRFSTGRYGWWPQSISSRAHNVLPVRYFLDRGLVSLESEWHRRKATPATAAAASMRALRAADGNIGARL